MKLFEVFGDVALKGQEAVDQGLTAIDKKGRTAADRMDALGSSVSSAGSSMTKWVTGPIAGLTAALGGLVTSTQKYGDKIAKASRETGLATDSYQQMQYALQQVAGVSESEVDRALGRLNQRLQMAKDGSDKYTAALESVGFSQEQIASGSLTAERAFDQVVKAMGEAESASEAAGIAGELLGTRIGRRLGPALQAGGDAVADLRKEFVDLGLGMDEEALAASEKLGDRMDTLSRQMGAAGRQIGEALLPIAIRLAEYLSAEVVPVVQSLAGKVMAVVDAFSSLPEPVQGVVGAATALAAILGPTLLVMGKLITVTGKFIAPMLSAGKAVAGLAAAAGPLAAGIGSVVAAAAPLIAIVVGIGAAIAAAIIIFKNWDKIIEVVGDALRSFGDWMKTGFSQAWQVVKQFGSNVVDMFRKLPQMVMRLVGNMARGVVNKLRNMVKNAIGALKGLYKKVVGNSIIPDMVNDVGAEMTRMADEGTAAAGEMSRGVSRSLSDTQSGFEGSVAAGGSGGAGGAVNVDMRHAIIRDDRDMSDRLRRAGSEQAWA